MTWFRARIVEASLMDVWADAANAKQAKRMIQNGNHSYGESPKGGSATSFIEDPVEETRSHILKDREDSERWHAEFKREDRAKKALCKLLGVDTLEGALAKVREMKKAAGSRR